MMLSLVIQMNERSLDLTQSLKPRLQRLSDVMRLQQTHLRRQHDVHLNQQTST